MNILITNDDGIHAEGIKILSEWAQSIGNVTIVAPEYKQSGKSQSAELHLPFMVRKYDIPGTFDSYSIESSPADCIRYALSKKDKKYDLVLSEINPGYNIGYDIAYSATCGAALEASYSNIKSIAFSADPSGRDYAAEYLNKVYNFIFDIYVIYFTDTAYSRKNKPGCFRQNKIIKRIVRQK